MTKKTEKPATKADLKAGFSKIASVVRRDVQKFLKDYMKLSDKILKSYKDFLGIEKAILAKLKDHEERLKRLENREGRMIN